MRFHLNYYILCDLNQLRWGRMIQIVIHWIPPWCSITDAREGLLCLPVKKDKFTHLHHVCSNEARVRNSWFIIIMIINYRLHYRFMECQQGQKTSATKQKHFVFVSLPNHWNLSETKTFCFCFTAKSLKPEWNKNILYLFHCQINGHWEKQKHKFLFVCQ